MLPTSQRCLLVASFIAAAATPVFAGELVFNGGFETGDFSGWNVPAPMSMQNLFFVSGGDAHSGTYYGRLSSTQLQYISQTLPTQAGQDYELSFWLRWYFGMQSEFVTVRWEGQPVLFVQGTGPGKIWTHFTLPLHANITGSFLEFGQNAFPGEFHIDTISVVAVPTPSAAAVLVMAGGAAAMRRRRR